MNDGKKTSALESGKLCTVSGEYEKVGSITTIVFLSRGDVMPEYCGKKVKWILVRKG
ncbi:hypothetical protein [Chryseobacterium turcicum]|uniref:Uncharacterized protein n=1 Tax=Chryseobacterium turcicum TaxID=2898076 RepID=A0A9Q3YW31_9FLAO|nr:hypothetical protein [Chryseobacterium turcicum]MCD1117538.1 hypothetical protein [Chryseobacterium turcicum]